jgi:predicted lipoprotein with Yx(FWY)xxD motif
MRARCALLLAAAGVCVASAAGLAAPTPSAPSAREVEAYQAVPMPPGFRVESTELDGPVFADSAGHTLYTWPQKAMRNGHSGEAKGMPECTSEVHKETAGLMSPYPPGLELPELDKRPSCTDEYPPVFANADAKPVGKWTVIDRKDGKKQWAYDEQPLYTSRYDRQPGEVLGGTTRRTGLDAPAFRVPAKPPSLIPPGFAVKSTSAGRLLTNDKNFSVYVYDKDTPTSSACNEECTKTWNPLIAPRMAQPRGEWSLLERSAGVTQWVFRGKPLYTYVMDRGQWSLEGSDNPGWSNVFVQHAPPPPADFTVQDTRIGEVLADHRGLTIYRYVCADDSVDQLSCDHPDNTQVYRLAMCGAGDATRCLKNWPYVLAQPAAKSISRSWSVMEIDPKTGHRASAGETDAVRVWAYLDSPVYTYGGDKGPGDINGTSTGEWRGQRNGLKAFALRDDMFGSNM